MEVENQQLLTSLKSQLDTWTSKLESLALYNMYIIDDSTLKQWVTTEHETDDTTSLDGVNFISLLKNQDFFDFYQRMITVPKYYSGYFNEYIFKGKNLYNYWATEHNPMFLLTYAIATNQLNIAEYIECSERSNKELDNV